MTEDNFTIHYQKRLPHAFEIDQFWYFSLGHNNPKRDEVMIAYRKLAADIKEWCEANVPEDQWRHEGDTFTFAEDKHAAMFKLRWMR